MSKVRNNCRATGIPSETTTLDEDISYLKQLPRSLQYYVLYRSPVNVSCRSVLESWEWFKSRGATEKQAVQELHRTLCLTNPMKKEQ